MAKRLSKIPNVYWIFNRTFRFFEIYCKSILRFYISTLICCKCTTNVSLKIGKCTPNWELLSCSKHAIASLTSMHSQSAQLFVVCFENDKRFSLFKNSAVRTDSRQKSSFLHNLQNENDKVRHKYKNKRYRACVKNVVPCIGVAR